MKSSEASAKGQEGGGSSGNGPLPVSILKSALQKNVRLSRADEATRVAYQLIQMGHLEDLLRRAVIIMFEDAVLHPHGVVILVWLMMAVTRGYNPDPVLIRDVLKVVYNIARVGWKDWDFSAYASALKSLKVR